MNRRGALGVFLVLASRLPWGRNRVRILAGENILRIGIKEWFRDGCHFQAFRFFYKYESAALRKKLRRCILITDVSSKTGVVGLRVGERVHFDGRPFGMPVLDGKVKSLVWEKRGVLSGEIIVQRVTLVRDEVAS